MEVFKVSTVEGLVGYFTAIQLREEFGEACVALVLQRARNAWHYTEFQEYLIMWQQKTV